MLAILSAPGSRGDVNPMIAIGRQLSRVGFDVVISVAEPYAHLAQAAGLQTEVVISNEKFETALANPGVWKPIQGARAVLGMIAIDFLPAHFDLIRRYHQRGQTVLVSHPLDFSSRVYRDFDPATPLIDVHLAPAVLRTPHAPARLSPWRWEIDRPKWAVNAAYWLADRCVLDPVIAGPVNRLRAEHALPPVSRLLNQWWLSPDRIIAMYPQWFAPATAVFGPRLVYAGFPLEDLDQATVETPTSQRPIVFTAGTANHHCRRFFQHAAQVCSKLNHPGILLSTHRENFPDQLPALVQTRSYVSLRTLLPSCAAIVHHGGIGTTSQAIAAGTPQIIRPLAFDQFDNAARVEQLGCGVWLRRDHQLSKALARCLAGDYDKACQAAAGKIDPTPAAKLAADEIGRIAGKLKQAGTCPGSQ